MSDGWTMLQRWWRSPAHEVLFALGMTAITVFGAYAEAHPRQLADKIPAGTAAAHTPTAAIGLVAVASLVLAVRHKWPVAVLVTSVSAVAAYSLLGYVNGAALLAPTAALYAVASVVPLRKALSWTAATLVVLLGATAARNPFGVTGAGFFLIPALIAAAGLGGIAVASRRAYVASIEARAAEDARRRIDEERLRIARELHDVVAHTMATINVQAGVAAHVQGERPDAVGEALQNIKAASKEGLRELRAILNVLRQADEPDSTQPAPGIARLGELLAGACRAGLETSLTVTGEPRSLPAATDLAAFRIIQESLTNAIRHAGPATADVSLSYTGTDLVIKVTDTGRGVIPGVNEGAGHGLIGMRERAVSVGGTLEAGPRASAGYRVWARLPVGKSSQAANGAVRNLVGRKGEGRDADARKGDTRQGDGRNADARNGDAREGDGRSGDGSSSPAGTTPAPAPAADGTRR
jgi:signal transduction histidine kinase